MSEGNLETGAYVTSEAEERVIAEFSATLPQIQSAVSFGGGSCRVKLDIPESDLAEAIKLAAYAPDRVLKVRVSAE